MMKGDRTRLEAVAPEGVHERVALVPPAIELDRELDRAVGGFHDREGVEPQRLEVAPDRRDGRLADTDRADRRRFHQGDGNAEPLEAVGE